MDRLLVIGAANIDIFAKSSGPLLLKDSNPGEVRLSVGGVGYNVAAASAALGADVTFLSVLADDPRAAMIRSDAAKRGLNIIGKTVQGARSGTYAFIADEGGDMVAAVNDMGIQDAFTPGVAEEFRSEIEAAEVVFIDTNLPKATIEAIVSLSRGAVFTDPVSVAKCRRLSGVLPKIYAIKPNIMELEALTGIPAKESPKKLQAALDALLETGVKRIYLTLGPEGALCAEKGYTSPVFKSRARNIVNCTGAGDTFAAALITGYLRGIEGEKALSAALDAAALTIASEETVSTELGEFVFISDKN